MSSAKTPAIFTAQHLAAEIARLAGRAKKFVVAYSGGGDSTALLHAMQSLRAAHGWTLRAAHFNHALQVHADDWQCDCETFCAQLDVPFLSARDDGARQTSRNLEARAREARYRWFQQICGDDEVLLTAHHADDQLESVLLETLRGAPQPVGIPARRALGANTAAQVVRPLLQVGRAQLRAYLKKHELSYAHDPMNAERDYDRVYLRECIAPLIEKRWPHARAAVGGGAQQAQANAAELQSHAENLLQRATFESKRRVFCLQSPLGLDALLAHPDFLLHEMLRLWLHAAGVAAPTRGQLHEWTRQVRANPDGVAELHLPQASLRQYRRHVYLTPRIASPADDLAWRPPQPARFAQLQVTLARCAQGVAPEVLQSGEVALSWRRYGARVRLPHRPTRDLKKWFQQYRVPVWEREALPLVRVDGEIAWVPGVGATAEFAAADGVAPAFCLTARA